MEPKPPYPLRCPVCGAAMVGEKFEPDSPDFDMHHCLNCDTIVEVPQEPTDED